MGSYKNCFVIITLRKKQLPSCFRYWPLYQYYFRSRSCFPTTEFADIIFIFVSESPCGVTALIDNLQQPLLPPAGLLAQPELAFSDDDSLVKPSEAHRVCVGVRRQKERVFTTGGWSQSSIMNCTFGLGLRHKFFVPNFFHPPSLLSFFDTSPSGIDFVELWNYDEEISQVHVLTTNRIGNNGGERKKSSTYHSFIFVDVQVLSENLVGADFALAVLWIFRILSSPAPFVRHF